MAKMSDTDQREAGLSHLTYMRELLETHGDEAKIELHADHMRSLLAAATPNKNVPA